MATLEEVEREIAEYEQRCAAIDAQVAALQEQHTALQNELDKILQVTSKLHDRFSIMDEDLDRMQRLVEANEQALADEEAYRLECKRLASELKIKVALLDPDRTGQDELRLSVEESQRRLEQAQALLERTKLQLANLPTASELARCQRRFFDLYAHLTEKLTELKQLYDEFNTLSAIQTQLRNEASLLSSVLENFDKATTRANQDRLVDSVYDWQKAANDTLIKANSSLQNERRILQRLSERHDQLAQLQQEYQRLVAAIEQSISQNTDHN